MYRWYAVGVKTKTAGAGKRLFALDATSLEAYDQPPTPSRGWDLRANVVFIEDNPWIAIFPGLAIFITVFGFNLFGDGLHDALDPRLKQ